MYLAIALTMYVYQNTHAKMDHYFSSVGSYVATSYLAGLLIKMLLLTEVASSKILRSTEGCCYCSYT